MSPRPVSLLLAVAVWSGAMTCGDTSSAAGAAGMRTVTYGGVTVRVPGSWPVYDLAASPRTCVRYDRHAVYLGVAGTDQDCPAHAIGRTEALLIAPDRTGTPSTTRPRTRSRDTDPGGDDLSISRLMNGVRITASFADDGRQADRIVESAQVTDPDAEPPADPVPPQERSAKPTESAEAAASGTAIEATWQTSSPKKLPDRSTYAGNGFDTCAAPSIGPMSAWAKSSPYRAAGIYIGGSDRACPDGNLNPTWIRHATGEGWQLFPIYVGRQAPCWNDHSGAKAALIDPAHRSDQGIQAANDAADRAAYFGLAPGSAVYFDMEAYPRTDPVCAEAVKAFLKTWTRQLHARGYLSGVYSSTLGAIADLVDIYSIFAASRPDAVWFAHWDQQASVFGDANLADHYWRGHQRIKQYSGGHDETYGGRTVNVDADVLDAPVAVIGPQLMAQSAYAPGLLYDKGDGTSTLYSWSSDGSSFPGPTTSGPYDIDAAKVGDRVAVCGFTGAGSSDLADVESADGGRALIRVHPGGGRPGSSFALTGTPWWTGSLPGAATARVAAGDFDGDGRCDLAALVDPGDGTGARVYRWLSTGTGFAEPTVWQASATWSATRMAGRVVAGKFTGARHADLALAAQDPDGTMEIHVLAGAIGAADGTPGPPWYRSGQFALDRVGARVVAGRFAPGSNSGLDDLAMLYDRGDGTSTLYSWRNTGSSAFAMSDAWKGRYDASTVGPRLAAADLTGTGITDVVAAAQRSDGKFAFHVWERASDYTGGDGWYVSGLFPLSAVGGRLVML